MKSVALFCFSQGREVDVGGDVLEADAPEGLVVRGVSVVADKGAREPGRGVEVPGGVAVVDGEDVAGVEGLGEGASEGVKGEVYLSLLAFYEGDVEVG